MTIYYRSLAPDTDSDECGSINTNIDDVLNASKIIHRCTLSYFVGKINISVVDVLEETKKGATNVPVNVARIQGMCDDYIMLIAQNQDEQDNTKLGKNMVLMDSCDGIEHNNTKNK